MLHYLLFCIGIHKLIYKLKTVPIELAKRKKFKCSASAQRFSLSPKSTSFINCSCNLMENGMKM